MPRVALLTSILLCAASCRGSSAGSRAVAVDLPGFGGSAPGGPEGAALIGWSETGPVIPIARGEDLVAVMSCAQLRRWADAPHPS